MDAVSSFVIQAPRGELKGGLRILYKKLETDELCERTS